MDRLTARTTAPKIRRKIVTVIVPLNPCESFDSVVPTFRIFGVALTSGGMAGSVGGKSDPVGKV